MSDLINRQDAIDSADEIIKRDTSGNNAVVEAMKAWKAYVGNLPSAEHKRGEWVDKWHTLWKENLPVCSVCNNISVFKSNYCPNCGARMDERREDER